MEGWKNGMLESKKRIRVVAASQTPHYLNSAVVARLYSGKVGYSSTPSLQSTMLGLRFLDGIARFMRE